MQKFFRSALWLFGTLAVGALGNGLWELAKPALVLLSTGILDIATLGLSSLRDSLYVDIAKGPYERAGEKLLSMALGVFAGFALFSIFIFTFIPKTGGTQVPGFLKILAASGRKGWWWSAALGIFIIFSFVQNYSTIYVIRAAAHMEQAQRVIAPYISEQERLKFASRAASLRTRNGYVELIADISNVAKSHNIEIPDFSVY